MKQPSVLVIAEAANPEWVSVPLVGWSLSHALRNVANVHLVTQVRNRDAIVRAQLSETEDFTAIDSEALARPMNKVAKVLRMGSGKGWTMTTAINAISYPYFERCVWREFGDRIRAGEFDIVHRVTPLSPTINSLIARRCAALGVPFVMGPLNGGVPWPAGFDSERRREREWLSYIRGVYKMLPGRAGSLNATAAIIAGSRHTANEIPAKHQHKVIYLPENAIDPSRFNRTAAQDVSGPLRACFIGRMVPYKGPDMLLEAAAPFLREGQLVLDMIGDGPMMDTLRAQADTLGITKTVCFHGKLPHQQVQDVAARANLLTFPSIREFGGGVVLEAMSLGVVPVIVDYAGPGELVDAQTGYKVPIGGRNEIIENFQSLLGQIIANPDDLPAIAKAAQQRVQEYFTWDAKARQVAKIYDWVLDPEGPKPDPLAEIEPQN